MKILLTICGILWLVYSLLALSVNLSIHTTPGKILNLKIYLFLFITVGILVGILFVFSSQRYKNRQLNIQLETSLINLLLKGKFRTSILELAMINHIKIQLAAKFVEKRLNAFQGNMHIGNKGIITYGKIEHKKVMTKK